MKHEQKRLKIAERLREARSMAGLSQGQVAKILKMHRPTISEIEAGNRKVSAEEIMDFADIYEVSSAWILGDIGETFEINNPKIQLAARELAKIKPTDLEKLLRLIASMKDV